MISWSFELLTSAKSFAELFLTPPLRFFAIGRKNLQLTHWHSWMFFHFDMWNCFREMIGRQLICWRVDQFNCLVCHFLSYEVKLCVNNVWTSCSLPVWLPARCNFDCLTQWWLAGLVIAPFAQELSLDGCFSLCTTQTFIFSHCWKCHCLLLLSLPAHCSPPQSQFEEISSSGSSIVLITTPVRFAISIEIEVVDTWVD